MTDKYDKETRSRIMSKIKSKNSLAERIVRKFLFANGIRFRIHVKELPGKPDIVIKKYNTIIDVRGCFWHGHKSCKYGDQVKSDSSILIDRVYPAINRDKLNEKKWKQLGWDVIVVWERCELEAKKKYSEKRDKVLKSVLNKILKNK